MELNSAAQGTASKMEEVCLMDHQESRHIKAYFSVIVPMYNEEANIAPLHEEITKVMDSLSKDYEVIYVNDCSTDNSLQELKKLKKVKIINLNRNYGQATALDAGFKEARGEIIISMDGDLQNDPHDIPKLLKELQEKGLDVVAGWRRDRKDKSSIKALTKTGQLLRRVMISDVVHDTGCTLRVYKKEAVKNLDLTGEMHRYILPLLRWKGFRIGELEVNHRPRINGKTKYGLKKATRGFIDLIHVWFLDKYSQRPLHIFGSLGLSSLFFGIIIESWMLYEKITQSFDLSGNAWFILGFFLIISGIMLFSFGIILDLLIKIHMNTSPCERRYNIRELIQN